MAFTPGPPESIGDDYGNVRPGSLLDATAYGGGRAIGIFGQERDEALRADVGGVDAGVGADEPMLRLGDEDWSALADDAIALAENELDEARVLLRLDGQTPRLGGRSNAVQRHDTAFRLRDNLLSNDNNVAGLDAGVLTRSLDDQGGQVVVLTDFRQAEKRDDADFGHVPVVIMPGRLLLRIPSSCAPASYIPVIRTPAWAL